MKLQPPWLARVLDADGRTAGTGIAVDAEHVLTRIGENRPHGPVRVEFPFLPEPVTIEAEIAELLGAGPRPAALLRLAQPVPGLTGPSAPAPLGRSGHLDGRAVRLLGFTAGEAADLATGEAEAGPADAVDRMRLRPAGVRDWDVDAGAVGGPVWDKRSRRVIGQITEIDDRREHALAIPLDHLPGFDRLGALDADATADLGPHLPRATELGSPVTLPPGGWTPGAPPAHTWRPTRRTLVVLLAAAAAVAVAVPLVWKFFLDPYRQRPFDELESVATGIDYADDDPGFEEIYLAQDHALFVYTGSDSTVYLHGVDADSGESIWSRPAEIAASPDFDDDYYEDDESRPYFSTVVSDGLIAVAVEDRSDDSSEYKDYEGYSPTEYVWHFFDWDTGRGIGTVDGASSQGWPVGDRLVTTDAADTTVSVYDNRGSELQQWAAPSDEGVVSLNPARTWDAYLDADFGFTDGRVLVASEDDRVELYEVGSSEPLASGQIPTDDYLLYEDRLFTLDGGAIGVYDLDTLEFDHEHELADAAVDEYGYLYVCGETRICVDTYPDYEDGVPHHLTVYDFDDQEVVFELDDYGGAVPAGRHLLVWDEGGQANTTRIYDHDFDPVGEAIDGFAYPIDGGSALLGTQGMSGPLIGLGVHDGEQTTLTDELDAENCTASDSRLACFHGDGMWIYRFR
ncbi:hypothetical protein [Glycomyces buryatensis]|uniref:Uncharacterized protein n=1 Tax=Glycomyces buryatensis TaxID=2570927 RepID=A0A4S8PRR4_9ACTN|nr:hypothetical protein [Glycomyces buryatensis]THV33947.1 hypothetical protein FAB82_24555 [Glycomyces buryatensis]